MRRRTRELLADLEERLAALEEGEPLSFPAGTLTFDLDPKGPLTPE